MKNITNFNSFASLSLYIHELKGQISDGKYENSRPYYHWQWIIDSKESFNPAQDECGTTRYIMKKYNYNGLLDISVIRERMLFYGRFGKMCDKLYKKCNFEVEELDAILRNENCLKYFEKLNKYDLEGRVDNGEVKGMIELHDILLANDEDNRIINSIYNYFLLTDYSLTELRKDMNESAKWVNTEK